MGIVQWVPDDVEPVRIPELCRLVPFVCREPNCFTAHPDYRPYTHTAIDARIFDPKKTVDRRDPGFKHARRKLSILLDDPEEVERLARQGR